MADQVEMGYLGAGDWVGGGVGIGKIGVISTGYRVGGCMGGVANEGGGGGVVDLVSARFECRLYVLCETICPLSPQSLQRQRRRSMGAVGLSVDVD
jgi:hypothetical protein